MTREEFQAFINKISAAFVEDDDIMNEMRRAVDEYPDREVAESPEDTDETVIKNGETDVDWRSKYDDLSRRYRERFFTNGEEVKEAQREDIEKDGERLTFESLFKTREGDYN